MRLTEKQYRALGSPKPHKRALAHSGKPQSRLAVYFHGLPTPTPEYRFAPPRRWRFDLAFVDQKVAIEQEGGVWIQGRHSRGAGMVKDMEKYNAAGLLGWRVFRFTPQQIQSGEARLFMLKAL